MQAVKRRRKVGHETECAGKERERYIVLNNYEEIICILINQILSEKLKF